MSQKPPITFKADDVIRAKIDALVEELKPIKKSEVIRRGIDLLYELRKPDARPDYICNSCFKYKGKFTICPHCSK